MPKQTYPPPSLFPRKPPRTSSTFYSKKKRTMQDSVNKPSCDRHTAVAQCEDGMKSLMGEKESAPKKDLKPWRLYQKTQSGSSQAMKNRFSNLKKKDLNVNQTKANNGFFHFSRA